MASPGFSFAGTDAIATTSAGVVVLVAVIALSSHSAQVFTPASVYLALGVLASVGMSAFGLRAFDPFADPAFLEHLCEFAVIIALFGAGLRIDRRLGGGRWRSTVLLVGVVMPLTILAVSAFGHLAMGLSVGAAVVLGAALAPTDPVLARDVKVGPPGEGDRSEIGFALSSEAGINDGIAFPVVYLGLLVAGGGFTWFEDWLLPDVLYAIVGGVAIGFGGGHLIAGGADRLRRADWLAKRLDGWLAIAAVLTIYGVAELAGTYGFLAAFAGGLGFRRFDWDHESHSRVHTGADLVEDVSELGVILVLFSTVTIAGLGAPGITGWALVPLLLIVIRPALTMVAFARSSVSISDRALIGWFGIRGVGSFYYAAAVLHAGILASDEASVLYWTVMACVGASILTHGATGYLARSRLSPDR